MAVGAPTLERMAVELSVVSLRSSKLSLRCGDRLFKALVAILLELILPYLGFYIYNSIRSSLPIASVVFAFRNPSFIRQSQRPTAL